MLPVGRCSSYAGSKNIYLITIDSKEYLEKLPAYEDDREVDYEHEEKVRGVYRTPIATNAAASEVDASATIDESDRYDYEREPELYKLDADVVTLTQPPEAG